MSTKVIALGLILFFSFASLSFGALQVGFYNGKCGFRDVESIVAGVVADAVENDGTLVAALLRLQFHDCFVSVSCLLVCGHTVGVSQCLFFKDRLYNYKKTGRPDPTIDSWFLNDLRDQCPEDSNDNNVVFLDQTSMSSFVVDKSFHKQIWQRRGILEIDQQLALHPLTKDLVTRVAFGFDFASKFGDAMIKMGRFGVLTGSEGEIRRTCEAVNSAW
ncbi:Peroxidase 60, partial [Cucurbita argyrosperma subsp. argyrosperma]